MGSAVNQTWLGRLDPRVKLWFVAAGITLLLVTGDVWIIAGVLAVAHLVLLAGGIPARQIGTTWRALVPLVLIILILQPLFMPGEGTVLWRIGPVRITEEGLINGVRYVLRFSAAAFVVIVAVATTPIPTLVRGMEKLGLPYSLGLTVGLALRYVETLGDLYHTISEAQQARGWDLSEQGTIKRVRAGVPTLVALIIASLRLSDSLALGLAARGFGLQRVRTYYRDIAMTKMDWATIGVITLAFIATLLLLFI